MASILTQTLTVNAAFFQEIKEVNQELWRLLDRLRDMCFQPSQIAAQRKQFLSLVDALRDQLALHFALEEAYGYFEDPVHVAPRLCDRARALRDEHRQLYLRLCRLEERADEMLERRLPVGNALSALASDFIEFDEQLKQHETDENRLIQQEYGDDIGVGD